MENRDFQNFSAVWERVSSAENQPKETKLASALRGFLDTGAGLTALYRRLAAQCTASGDIAVLRRLAVEEASALVRLRTALFLLEGDSYNPSPQLITDSNGLTALRAAYLAERQCAAAYREAANLAEVDTAKLLFQLAGLGDRHAEALWERIARALR